MSQYHPSLGFIRAAQSGKFFHEKVIRNTVKTITADALRLITAGNRQKLGHLGHFAVKSRVETGHLLKVRKLVMKGIDDKNLHRHVFGIVRAEFKKLFD